VFLDLCFDRCFDWCFELCASTAHSCGIDAMPQQAKHPRKMDVHSMTLKTVTMQTGYSDGTQFG